MCAGRRSHRSLLWLNAHIPPPIQGKGIDRNDAVPVGKFVKAREYLHVVGILIHAMQQNHNRIVLLWVIAFWQPDQERAFHVADRNILLRFLFLRLLRTKRLYDKNHR